MNKGEYGMFVCVSRTDEASLETTTACPLFDIVELLV